MLKRLRWRLHEVWRVWKESSAGAYQAPPAYLNNVEVYNLANWLNHRAIAQRGGQAQREDMKLFAHAAEGLLAVADGLAKAPTRHARRTAAGWLEILIAPTRYDQYVKFENLRGEHIYGTEASKRVLAEKPYNRFESPPSTP